jgi:hypothetical protein
MIRMRTRAIALTTAAVAAASLAMTGTSLAAASPARTAAAAAKTGTEYIQEMSASATSPVSQVVAYGMFTAAGTDTQAPAGNSDTLRFPGGTFVATYKVTGARNRVDPGTCVSTLVLDISYKLGKGTGKFAGITGSGHATNTQITLAARGAHGGCSATRAIAQQSLIEASGPVALK